MTGRIKYINIDGRFCNQCDYTPFADYCIKLHDHMHHVKSFTIASIEIPITFYNISCALDNNYFKLTNLSSTNDKYGMLIKLPDNNYSADTFNETIAELLKLGGIEDLEIRLCSDNGVKIISKSSEYAIDFAVDINGKTDEPKVKSKLGWLLGFRKNGYRVRPPAPAISESICNLANPRYVYLEMEEFERRKENHNKHAFSSSLLGSHISKYIIARIAIDYKAFPYGSMLIANLVNGFLISNKRIYNKKIDIKDLQFRLLNEFGDPICLNGFDVSFCAEVECESDDECD